MRVGAGRILVVEDEAPIRYALADVLRSEGYEVDTATNGAEASPRCASAAPMLCCWIS